MLISNKIAVRYAFSFIKRNVNKYVKLITYLAVTGLILSVAALLTVSSVVNGFEQTVLNNVYRSLPNIILIPVHSESNANSQCKLQQIQQHYVADISLYALQQTDIFTVINNKIYPLHVVAMPMNRLPKEVKQLLYEKHQGIVLNHNLQEEIAIHFPQDVQIISQNDSSITIKLIGKYDFDLPFMQNIAFTTLPYMHHILHNKNIMQQYGITLHNPYNSAHFVDILTQELINDYQIIDWQDYLSGYLQTISSSKTVLLLMLSAIVLMAIFNIIISIFLLIRNKTREIAILRSLGLSKAKVFALFLLKILYVTITGVILGLGLGILLSKNMKFISQVLQKLLGYELINTKIYFINYLPAKLYVTDIIFILTGTMTFTILSALVPAYLCCRRDPATILKSNI